MTELLGITAFVLALTAIFVSGEVLRRIERRNQTLLDAQAREIKAVLLKNEQRKEAPDTETVKIGVENVPFFSFDKREANASYPGRFEYERFVPFQYRTLRRNAA